MKWKKRLLEAKHHTAPSPKLNGKFMIWLMIFTCLGIYLRDQYAIQQLNQEVVRLKEVRNQSLDIKQTQSQLIDVFNHFRPHRIAVDKRWSTFNSTKNHDRYKRLYSWQREPKELSKALCPKFGSEGNSQVEIIASLNGDTVPFVQCIIHKVGSSMWKRAYWRIMENRPVQVTQQVIHGNNMNSYGRIGNICQFSPDQAKQFINSDFVPRFLLVRNPYTRFLSGYMDKIVYQKDNPDFYVNNTRYPELLTAEQKKLPTLTFDQFVLKAYKKFKKINGFEERIGINPHFALQSSQCGLQQGMTYDMIYKVENINDWLNQFIDELNLERVFYSGWPTQDKCFLSTLKHPCNGPKALVNDNKGIVFQSTNSTTSIIGVRHRMNASDNILQYLTKKNVLMLNEIFMPDFKIFNYQRWDGVDPSKLVLN